jgi:hypothetical protein
MCATQDPEVLGETIEHILNKARDQDVMHYLNAMQANFKARRRLAQFFKDYYDAVSLVSKRLNRQLPI